MDISVIIPSKKESATIVSCIQRVAASCPGAEILIVDSGIDDTESLVRKLKDSIPNLNYILNRPDRGKGDAIKNGILKSTGKIIVQIDSDLQFLPEEIPRLLAPLLSNTADMVLGSRFMAGSVRKTLSVPGIRPLGNKIISGWASILFGQKITDGMAGLKAWRREVTDSFELTRYHFSYEIELFAKAILKGWRVIDVPITTEPRLHGESTLPPFKTGFTVLKDSLLFRFFR